MSKNTKPATLAQLASVLNHRGGSARPHNQGGNNRNVVNSSNHNALRDPWPSAMNLVKDGVDHINVWDAAETELGKLLCNNSPLSFVHNVLGKFYSIESFWHYIQSVERDDSIRTMYGPALKSFSRRSQSQQVKNFRAVIIDAAYQRIKQYPALAEAMAESTLKFECYYIDRNAGGLRVRPNFFKWLILGFEEIRLALKENREPELKFLMDDQSEGADLYEGIRPQRPAAPEPVQTESEMSLTKAVLLQQQQNERDEAVGDYDGTVTDVAGEQETPVPEEIEVIGGGFSEHAPKSSIAEMFGKEPAQSEGVTVV